MRFERNPYRVFPDGNVRKVYPFHICLEGLESKILCKEDEDYDAFIKILAVASLADDVSIVAYTVVSNHLHVIVLADSFDSANRYGQNLKKRYSMYLRRKYGDSKALKGVDSSAIWIDSDWYLKNALAYVLRNAFDNGAMSLESYEWGSYRAYFCSRDARNVETEVSRLTKRDKAEIMRTCEDLTSVSWLLDESRRLVPYSICEWRYFEAAFDNSQIEMLKRIGQVNMPEMMQKLVKCPRTMKPDIELLRFVNDVSGKWFAKNVSELPLEKKIRLLTYTYRTNKTTIAQLSRVFEIGRYDVQVILSRLK